MTKQNASPAWPATLPSAAQIAEPISTSTETQIWLRGKDLIESLIGHVGFSDVIFLLSVGRMPNAGESTVFDAALVALVEADETTQESIAARITFSMVPDSIQCGISSGLLALDPAILASVEAIGAALAGVAELPARAMGAAADPRVAALLTLAESKGVSGRHVEALKDIQGRGHPTVISAVTALLLDMGVSASLARGFVLISAATSMYGQVVQEQTHPLLSNETHREMRKEQDRLRGSLADGKGGMPAVVPGSAGQGVRIGGLNSATQLVGHAGLPDVIYLMATGRLPEAAASRLLSAALAAMVDHSQLNRTAIVSRTVYAASGSMAAGVAAAILGVSHLVLGAMQDLAPVLDKMVAEVAAGGEWDDVADRMVADFRQRKAKFPGYGHATMKHGDPRVPRLLQVAAELGFSGGYVAAMVKLEDAIARSMGRRLHPNVTAAVGAILLEIGVPAKTSRGFAVIARAAALIAHANEEEYLHMVPAFQGKFTELRA